jgi:hypothetical protein
MNDNNCRRFACNISEGKDPVLENDGESMDINNTFLDKGYTKLNDKSKGRIGDVIEYNREGNQSEHFSIQLLSDDNGNVQDVIEKPGQDFKIQVSTMKESLGTEYQTFQINRKSNEKVE